jgi:hypothetical protein
MIASKPHFTIDERGLVLAEEIVRRIDGDPQRRGLAHARDLCNKWLSVCRSPAIEEWQRLLDQDWSSIREILLDASEEGARLRQSSPFCGVLSPSERWQFYKKTGGRHDPPPA